MLWITREGASWRALPDIYGYWNTIYRRFGRWCDTGIFEALPEHFHDAGEISAIPPRDSRTEPRPYDEELYKRRNIIERFFHRLKQYRRVATRYDKLGIRYLGFVYFAAILITSKKM